MFLAAQRVVSPTTKRGGINAFLYSHRGLTWTSAPPSGLDDQFSGVLIDQSISVPPPGNRVRSFLDITAPDDLPWPEVRSAFMRFLAEKQQEDLPWVGDVDVCRFKVNMELALAAEWREELAKLYRFAEALRLNSGS